MKLAFLAYASRSGSTLLSRELSTQAPNVLVIPEIASLYRLLSLPNDSLAALPRSSTLAALDSHNQIYRSLRCDRSDLVALTRSVEGGSVDQLLVGLADIYLRSSRGQGECREVHHFDLVLFKLGSVGPLWHRLQEFLDDPLLCVVMRDPRGIVNSQLRSSIDGGRGLARGSVARACRDIRRFVNGLPATGIASRVNYEQLVLDPQGVVQELVDSFGVPASGRGTERVEFRVADDEANLHPLLDQEPVSDRANAWLSELSIADRAEVERRLPDLLPSSPSPFASATELTARDRLRFRVRAELRDVIVGLRSMWERAFRLLTSDHKKENVLYVVRRLRR